MISKFSVKKPYTVLVGVVLAIVLGVVSFTKMTTDLLPNISLPYVIVMTTYPGASPETVEMVVTKPVEASMATVSNIKSVSSMSSENYSVVIMEFAQSADMNAISLEIRENLDQIKSYWDDSVGNPIIMKLNPDMLPVMIAAVGVEGMDHAQISTYVQENIMPELESVEGVASVSADGLLEEQINVIIRREKVDELNKKIFASIDKKMEEAAQDIEEGKQKLEDGEQELIDGRAEIVSGQQELNSGKQDLEDGEIELERKKEETIEELAKTKNQLLTAKSGLEATKMNINTSLTTAEGLNTALQAMAPILEIRPKYEDAYARLQEEQKRFDSVSDSDSDTSKIDAIKKEIEGLKKAYLENKVVQTLAASDGSVAAVVSALNALDWCSKDDYDAVIENMSTLDLLVGVQVMKLEGDLSNATGGMGMEAYRVLMNQSLATVNDGLKKVDQGLIEIEKGEMKAAIEFSNASTQLALGKSQMEAAQAQLDAALEQINMGQDQMDDAREQLEEGQKQFEEAKDTAYKQADMEGILTVDTIKGLLTAQNFSMPAGYVTEEGVDYLVRVGDKPEDIEELMQLPLMDLHMDGVGVITLADVADVFYSDNSAATYTNVNGSVGCMLTIQKQTGYSTGEVSDLLGERFKELMETEEGLTIITLMDQGIFIDLVMDSIISNVLFGGLLAVVVLILFLKDMRPTLVVACSIPVSLVTAIVCMYFSGVTLNVISLSGLALGIGMLVDNSIVVIENIYRLRGEGYSMREAAIKGTGEVGGAIVASTLTTVCVFLPIVFTEGITRQLFVDMGLTIAYSLFASLFIAMTVVPAMASKILNKTKSAKEGKLFTGLINAYGKLLELSLKAKSLVIVLALALLVISVAAAWTKGTAFMSDMDSTQLTVTVTLPEEAKLEDTAELTNQVVERILEIEDVQNVGAMLSSTTMSSFTGGTGSTNSTTIYVVAYEDKTMTNEEIADIIEAKTEDLNAEISIQTSSMDMSAMGGSGISVQVRGRDIDTLQQVAKEVAAVVEAVEGTTDVSDGLVETGEELRIIVDKEKAISNGLTVAQVFSQIAPKLAEASAATTLEASDKDYSIYVENGKDTELTRQLVQELTVKGTDSEGKTIEIPLGDIAEFSKALSLNTINRVDNTRYITVSAAIAEGYNVGKVATVVEQRLKDYQLPEGCKLVFAGENETINDALGQVGLMMILAVIFMYLIMVAQFQSLKSPFIILFTIPLAFTGGFFGLFFSNSEISVIAMIGFVMLSGVIVNNGIVIVDYMNQLRENGMSKREAIIEAGKTRMRPVLMTALTTILALSTMVFSNDMGSEMAKPMSVVTIGGLSYGTLLTLIVIPCIYDIFNPERKKKNGVDGAVIAEYEETVSEDSSQE